MSYLALYRRYRPTTFDKLVGQEHIVKTLINQIENDKLGHAYLFTGTRGTGKTTAAKIFARAVNCLHPVNGSPCGECDACKALADASNIDVVEMDAASNNGVNEIRDLREKVQYAPVSCKYKVFIIDEVHMLSGSAFNALLKTLEEPPKHAIFILATTEAHKIPATILSRCMRFDFRLIETERIAKLIEDIYVDQGIKYEKEAVFALASAGEGSIRDALSVADVAVSYAKPKLTYESVTEILGTTNFDVLASFIKNMLEGNSGAVLSLTDKLCGMGKSVGVLTKDVTGLVRNILVIKSCANPNAILNLPDAKFEELQTLAKITTSERLIRILEIFAEIENTLKYSLHPRTVFETASVKATRPDSDYDMNALLARIKALEEKVENGAIVYKTVERVSEQPEIKTVPKVEKEEEKPVIKVEEEPEEKQSITEAGAQIVYGRILTFLRDDKQEMLWNVLQTVKLDVEGDRVILTTFGEGDDDLLSRPENISKINEALSVFLPSVVQVRKSAKNRAEDVLDEEAERLRKIFGDDMVVIKK